MIDTRPLEALALSFEQRANRALDGVRFTRAGYLSRDSIGLRGTGIAFAQAARELRDLIESPVETS